MNKSLIIRGKGKQGKYFPATKDYRGTILSADIFGKAAASKILGNEDFLVTSPFFENKTITNDELRSSLFLFSNKVGSIITYLLIQSMNLSNQIVRELEDDEEKDLRVERWIDDAISSLLPILLPLFKEYTAALLKGINCWNEDGSLDEERTILRYLDYRYRSPLYVLSKELISEFMASFSEVYPNVTNALENIRSQLPTAVDRIVSQWEYEAYCSQRQKHCKHEYGPPENAALAAKYNNNIKHCPKCHKTAYITSPFLR